MTTFFDKIRYRIAGAIEQNARALAAWIRFAGK
jgi:hypothetical protein